MNGNTSATQVKTSTGKLLSIEHFDPFVGVMFKYTSAAPVKIDKTLFHAYALDYDVAHRYTDPNSNATYFGSFSDFIYLTRTKLINFEQSTRDLFSGYINGIYGAIEKLGKTTARPAMALQAVSIGNELIGWGNQLQADYKLGNGIRSHVSDYSQLYNLMSYYTANGVFKNNLFLNSYNNSCSAYYSQVVADFSAAAINGGAFPKNALTHLDQFVGATTALVHDAETYFNSGVYRQAIGPSFASILHYENKIISTFAALPSSVAQNAALDLQKFLASHPIETFGY